MPHPFNLSGAFLRDLPPHFRYIITIMRDGQTALIIRLRDGDPSAFRELYGETQKMLYQYALYRLNGNAEAAEDVVADAYVDAMGHASSLTLNHNVKAWLYRITHAKVVDYVRSQVRKGKFIKQAAPVMAEGKDDDGPEERALKEEDARLVRAAFFKLQETSQDLLREKYHERLSVREMAKKRDKTEKAVESMLFRAKREFAEAITSLGKERIFLPDRKEETWHSLFQIVF